MARYILLFFILLLGTTTVMAQSSTSTLEGKLTDAGTGEGLIAASVVIYKPGGTTPIAGGSTDINGNYSIPSVDAGTYDVEFSYVGYTSVKQAGVILYANQVIRLNVKLLEGETVGEVEVTAYVVPLISQDQTTTGKTITAGDIQNLPSKSIGGIAATTAGVTSTDENGALNMRGSRSSGTIVYVDGIRVNGSTVPQTEVEQIEIMTGGISAAYGDATGGVISITTKGPSERFSSNFEIENSNYLDPYGYFLGYGSFSGPLWKKNGRSVLGYRAAVQYRRNGDRSPTATGVYKLTDDKFDELSANPVIPSDNGTKGALKALFLTEDDVELSAARPNSASQSLNFNGKIDLRINKAIDMSFGGTYVYSDGRASSGSLMNYGNTNYSVGTEYRGYGRFRHRLGNPADTSSLIRNLNYTIQFSYERRDGRTESHAHGDRFFDYGHVGEFAVGDAVPLPGILPGDSILRVTGYNYPIVGFTPSEKNPGVGAYNEGITELPTGDLDDYLIYNGRTLSNLLGSVYGLHANINEVYNQFNKNNQNQYQFNLTGSFEIVPGGGSGRHSIDFGLLYEERQNRSWSINPVGLWQAGRQLLNAQFDGVDVDIINGYIERPNQAGGIDSIPIHPEFPKDDIWSTTANEESQQSFFDRSVRTKFNYGRYENINIDEISPDDLSLDMFSADELLNSFGGIGYFGYDYLGNEVGGETSFGDFFDKKDANGNLLRPIAPNRPIYTAAFIQDKFRYKDIIFRVGLRVDRYDANTQVLKDNYSLFGTRNAADYASDKQITVPSNIGDDFVVYETGTNSGEIQAFRNGDQWYTAGGEAVNNPLLIFGGTQSNVALPVGTVTNVRSDDYDYESAFEDAEPQLVVMPRLAFSFPINEDAGFFAHYDVLTQRPPSSTLATPLSYYNFNQTVADGGNLNNPNLRPERTIDYQVGFQQKLTNSSALKVSLYYRELRDQIQSQYYAFASPQAYFGYGNQDYGTVKGMTLEYDLRRTGNVRLVANYTLQFAEGTGSSVGSQRDIAIRGNLRNIFPLSFDERHRVTLTLDYRYKSGKTYNGPELFGKQIFANAGANLLAVAASGRPYSRAQVITGPFNTAGVIGGYNSARLPWNTRLDLRIDKNILLRTGQKADGTKKSPISINVYFRVQNILDARNILGVYDYSQSPEDTGYLNSPIGSATVAQLDNDLQEYYRSSYNWAMLNPGFYTLPRRMYVGAILSF
jgi:outer membrane receptor protein involved in Fe transport